MLSVYHRQDITREPIAQHIGVQGTPRGAAKGRVTGVLTCLLLLSACDAVEIVEGSDTHVSIRYDGIMNGLDQATQLAQKSCAVHGKSAKLRKTYYEGLGAGERFAFFDCV
jgi:hypothetical protein